MRIGVCIVTLVALFFTGCATDVAAASLSPYRYEFQARLHCPEDIVVWLDFRRRLYYLDTQKRYAQGTTGSFVCREEARNNGYRRSLLGLR